MRWHEHVPSHEEDSQVKQVILDIRGKQRIEKKCLHQFTIIENHDKDVNQIINSKQLYGRDNTTQANALFSLWSLRKIEIIRKAKKELVKSTMINNYNSKTNNNQTDS